MKRSDPETRSRRSAGQSPAEIPSQQGRKHITEPSWIENMIYLTGVYLEKETAVAQEPDEAGEDKPPKTEAA